MANNHWWKTALLILIDILFLANIARVIWDSVDRLGWVRLVMSLPLPGWLKMILWGWY